MDTRLDFKPTKIFDRKSFDDLNKQIKILLSILSIMKWRMNE